LPVWGNEVRGEEQGEEGRMKQMESADRLRRPEMIVFCAYIAFVVAGMVLYGMVDDSPFIPAMNQHFELAAAWYAIAACSGVALLAVVTGGLPFGLAIVKRIFTEKRRDLLLLMAVPLIGLAALGTFVVVVAITTRFFSNFSNFSNFSDFSPAQQVDRWVPLVLAGLFIVATIASTVAMCLAVVRSDPGEQVLRMKGITIIVQPYSFAVIPAMVVTLAMALMLAATIAWGLVASVEAPQGFDAQASIAGPADSIMYVGIVAVMFASTLVAVLAAVAAVRVVRGFTARGL
jgi:hypothetical protein